MIIATVWLSIVTAWSIKGNKIMSYLFFKITLLSHLMWAISHYWVRRVIYQCLNYILMAITWIIWSDASSFIDENILHWETSIHENLLTAEYSMWMALRIHLIIHFYTHCVLLPMLPEPQSSFWLSFIHLVISSGNYCKLIIGKLNRKWLGVCIVCNSNFLFYRILKRS